MSGLVIVFPRFDAGIKRVPIAPVSETLTALGRPASVAMARGAILLTGYRGGATATHLRVGSPVFTHLLSGAHLGLLPWGGLACAIRACIRRFRFASEIPTVPAGIPRRRSSARGKPGDLRPSGPEARSDARPITLRRAGRGSVCPGGHSLRRTVTLRGSRVGHGATITRRRRARHPAVHQAGPIDILCLFGKRFQALH